jgi:hypothetical protein
MTHRGSDDVANRDRCQRDCIGVAEKINMHRSWSMILSRLRNLKVKERSDLSAGQGGTVPKTAHAKTSRWRELELGSEPFDANEKATRQQGGLFFKGE